jgi:hypothetical protein
LVRQISSVTAALTIKMRASVCKMGRNCLQEQDKRDFGGELIFTGHAENSSAGKSLNPFGIGSEKSFEFFTCRPVPEGCIL